MMASLRKRFKMLIKDRRGLVVVLVLCVMMLLFAFGGAMLVASSAAMGDVTVSQKQEQAYEGAYSFGQLLKRELADYTSSLKLGLDGITESSPVHMETSVDGVSDIVCDFTLADDVLTAVIKSTYKDSVYTLKYAFSKRTSGIWQFTGCVR